METETIAPNEEKISKDEQELQKKRKNNIKLYSIYRVFSWDMLFYYAIIYLFLTIEKDVTPPQFLQFDAFYILFRFVFQIPGTLTVQKFGKRKALILSNVILVIHMLFIIFAKNFGMLIFSQVLCAIGFNIKAICETDMLYDSISADEKRGSIFAKIDGKATSRYYYVDAISAIASGFLFVINPYIPMILCFVFLLITFFLSTRFEEIHPEKGKLEIKEELKNIKYGFKSIFKSKRLKSLLIFNGLFVGLIKILQSIRNTVLVEVGMPNQYFGIIFAVMGIIAGISARNQGKIHDKYRNKTLTVLALPTAISCLITGFVLLSNFKAELKIVIVLIMFALQYITKGPYYVIMRRYFNNFTTSEKRIKISTTNIFCENAIASLLIFAASSILEFVNIDYTSIIVGCVFTIGFVLLLDIMKKTVGLKPEEYSKKEIL